MLKEVDKTSSDEPEGESWMAQTLSDIFCYGRRSAFVGRFSCGHIINGRCAGSRPVSRFDSGCFAIAFRILTEYTLLRCTRTGDRRDDDYSRDL